MGIEKIETENADHALTKALELQAYLDLEGRNPIGTASSGSAGVNHMTNQFLTENTAIFDEFVRSLKRDTDNMPYNHNRESRDNFHNRERDRNNSMNRRSQHDSRENTRSRYENDTRDNRNTYMPSRIRKTNAMIHARDMDKDTILENVGRNNKIDRFDLSHLAMTRDKTAKTQTSTVEMHKTDHNHHTKTDDMTLIQILDKEATIMQPGPKTRYANTASELITLLENVKLVLIV